MKYDIYFHNDFDGRAAAAVMLNFLRQRGDDIAHFTPVNYELKPQWESADFFLRHKLFKEKRYPAIVVDFLYHPGAVIWLDHHPTTFNAFPRAARAFASKKFRVAGDGGFQHWGAAYPSCCGQALEELRRHFGYRPPKHIQELAKWLDVIDHAQYASPQQPIRMKEPALQLDWFIEATAGKTREAERMVISLAEKPMAEIAGMSRVARVLRGVRKQIKTSLAYYKKAMRVRGRIAVIDLTSGKHYRLRFAPYYLHPGLSYAMSFVKHGKTFSLGWGSNPWHRPKDGIHIGEFLRRYGGGGHGVAGGAELSSRRAVQKAVEEIVEYVNSKNSK
ncbi:MAG: hypothetical protein A3B25_03720 [Candidatus Ryanbacteria bacterium RIFCSPLOWO2_01_FULL_48_26]|uniref:DHHA1 domain-containing protein n=1 Tax=Candidatus Ryanbacteria bacterium RIFCSPLOWO2_01_FULL_48_26 TaxID=1802126 RepID=A0A1G2GSV4_9BACT|nr:MAG: hypothetical protein A3B25_03720 [Candidatus Ryanbacteria bacterium RIFCSPLOWO2_01_FULL_48_26]